MEHPDVKQILQKEYEKLIQNQWKFLNNEYIPIIKKNYHRSELQEINFIENIKKEILEKIGIIPTFVFITDFCNKFNIPGPYRDIEKGLVVLYHLLCGLSINQMETYLKYTNFFKMYKFIYIDHYDELNNWINNIFYNCSSNKNIRLLLSHINNPEIVKHVTLIMDGHHNKIVYENVTVNKCTLYSWKLKKPGLNTQFVIDTNGIVVFISESLPCKDNNDDKMLINNVNFNKFFTIYDNICFDGLYINTLHETIAKYSVRNLEIHESNFTFPIKKEKKKKLNEDEDKFNKCIAGFRSRIETYFANLGKIFKRFDSKSNVRVTKLETYNIQLRLCCALLNLKKISEYTNLDIQNKYSQWLHNGFDYPDKNGIIPKSDIVKYKINNMSIMKNRQIDTLNALLTGGLVLEENNEITYIDNDNINDKTYEIQYIIKHRIDNNGNKEYFVKWKNYNKKCNSWVKEKDFIEKDILIEYNNDIMDEDEDI